MDEPRGSERHKREVQGARACGVVGDGGKGMARQPDERAVGEGDGRLSDHAALGVGADKHTRERRFVFSKRDGARSCGAARPDRSHRWTTVTYHYRNL